MNDVHHLQRQPGRDGAALARGRRAAPAPGRPERRLRRQAGQRGGGQGDPAPRSATRSRCSSAAASATSTRSSATSTTACSYIIIGTAAVKNPGFLQRRLQRLRRPHHRRPRRQGRQGRDRRLEQAHRPRGGRPGARSSRTTASKAIIYTDIGRDGMLTGVNIEATVKLAQALTIPVFASGGLSSMADIEKLCAVRGRRHRGRDLRPRDLHRRPRLRRGAGPRRRARQRLSRRCRRPGAPPGDTRRHARQAHHSLPRRDRRPRRQGRQLRRAARRRRPGRDRGALQRAGRRRADLPRHHRHQRRPRPDPAHHRGGGVAGVHPADRRRRRAHASPTCAGCSMPAPTRSASTRRRSPTRR